MTVIEYSDSTRLCECGRVLAIGFFDGVHVGHRELFRRARNMADELSLPFSVFTFFSESESIKAGDRLYSTQTKLELIKECGADEVILADFNNICDILPSEFVNGLLIQKLNAVCAVTGRDFRFGKGAAGTVDDLSRLMAEAGLNTITVDDVIEDNIKISTTEIKRRLSCGDVRGANKMLGAKFRVSGKVLHGNGRGTSLGTPTANIPLISDSIPKHGVYSTLTLVGGVVYPSVTNVGICPTLGSRKAHTESYIIGLNADLYGKEISVFFEDFIREEKVFSSEKELKMQINIDINRVKKGDSDNGRKLD